MKKLQIGNFYVDDIIFGDKTGFQNGILTVNKQEALACLDPEERLKNLELHIVHPGDSIRIMPAKIAVEPRFRPDGRSIFPGLLGSVQPCGDGILYAMKGMSVICCGKYAISGDGLLDMRGLAAQQNIFASMVNIVVYGELIDPVGINQPKRDETPLKMATYYLAEYLGKALAGQQPEDWENFELEPGRKEAEEKQLPKVALVMSINAQDGIGRCCNEQIFGLDCENSQPLLLHPNAVLDGEVVSMKGLFGDCIHTYGFQNCPYIKRLYAEHGKTLNFAGVILCPCDSVDTFKKITSVSAAEIGTLLGLDGAIIVVTDGGSNWDVDFFYLLAEFEDHGIKTVGVTGEHNGKTMLDPKGNAIVSTGQSGQVFELEPMDKVIGDIESAVRDFYFGSWSQHEIYGPSLRKDGSLIVTGNMISDCSNNNGFTTKSVKDY